ncbi:hypothetical protein BGZ82_004944 [Podila clonocystis]|nr:hypothetical protein BGZ82_004944 [Podila clonocystis]
MGWFLPLWEPCKSHKDEYSFYPEDLLACVQVNKCWRRTLTPLLWIVYDPRNRLQSNAPLNMIDAHSPHFRYLCMRDMYSRVDLIRSTNLRELRFKTHQTCPDFEALALLIDGNPHITRLYVQLHWVNFASSKVLKRALESLPHLRVLNLNHGEDITNRWIAELLENISGLEELHLEEFDGLQPYRYQGPWSQIGQIFNSRYWNLGRVPPQPLLSVRKLTLDMAWIRNLGSTQVVRFCPKLESLALRGGRHICKSVRDELPKNLRECCPHFKSLQYIDRWVDWHRLKEEDQVNLIRSSQRLTLFDAPVRDFNSRIYQALLFPHAPFLETIRIRVLMQSSNRFAMVSRILVSCPQLETFELDTIGTAKFPEDIVGVFEQPWECPSLRVLKLTGFLDDFPSELQKRVAALSKYGLQVQEDQESSEKLDDVENEDEDGSETEQGDFSATENGSDSEESEDNYDFEEDLLERCSPWTRVYAELPEPDPKFHKSLAKCGWIRNKFHGRISKKPSRLEKIVQQLVLERLSNSTRIQKVTLEDYVFVHTRH